MRWWKEIIDLMAKLYAIDVINGNRTISRVPDLLKEKVKQILIDAGLEELTEE